MYPSKKDNYGVFCKKIFDFFVESKNFEIVKISAIYGKSNIKVYNICRYAVLLFSIFFNLTFKKKIIDIVYIQYVWKHAFFVTKFLNKLGGKKLFINFHGEDLTKYEFLSDKEKKQFQLLCDKATGIVVPSAYFKNLLLEIINLNKEKKIVISPSGGVDSSKFYLKNENKEEKRIIYCSRFDKDKGWDDYIEAASILLAKDKEYKFTMIGYGKETNNVIELLNRNKIFDRVELIVNPKQSLIAQKYAESDVFIFPTRLPESLGLVALEAMSCGLVTIASEVGAIPEYVVNNKTGFLYEKGNIEELVERIEFYFSLDKENKEYMKMAVLEMAEKYKDGNVQEVFLEEINNLVG